MPPAAEPTTTPEPTGDPLGVEPDELVLVRASGYIGGRLVGELVERGYRVRCLARTPAKLAAAPRAGDVEVVQGDIERPLGTALDGVAAVYYLVHTIGDGPDWVQRELAAAANVRDAAAAAGVRRACGRSPRCPPPTTPTAQTGSVNRC